MNVYQNQPPPAPVQSKGFAVTALVTGIVGVCVPYTGLVLGIVAIVFGALGLNGVKEGRMAGHGMAKAGFILGIIAVAWFILLVIIIAASSNGS